MGTPPMCYCWTANDYVTYHKSLVLQDVVEDLTHDEWYHIPDTNQIDSVDPIDIIASGPKRKKDFQ